MNEKEKNISIAVNDTDKSIVLYRTQREAYTVLVQICGCDDIKELAMEIRNFLRDNSRKRVKQGKQRINYQIGSVKKSL